MHNSSSKVRIAVVSDIHAYDSSTYVEDNAPSYFDISATGRGTHCPVESLLSLIADSRSPLAADVLLCPGDIADRACKNSLPVAWKKMQEVAMALKVTMIAATTGNHDVDSRFVSSAYDPIDALKDLEPRFPFNSQSICNQYWADHFYFVDTHGIRIVVLNSSAYHGGNIAEVAYGRVAPRTLKQLRDALNDGPDYSANVLLCHHNPQVHSELGLGEIDQIKGGQLLLDLIGEPGRGDWLVVHGHKHHPKLTYSAGGSSSPIVFSAGSLASTLYPQLDVETGNQFHIIELDLSASENWGLVGTFETWDWHQGYGWRTAESNKGLPASGGFGYRANGAALARNITDALSAADGKLLTGEELYAALPQLRFVTPIDLKSIASSLERRSAIMTIRDDGRIDEAAIV